MLKTQAAWNTFKEESVSSDMAFTEASNTHSELQLKSALKMNELLSCTSRRQSAHAQSSSKTNSDSKTAPKEARSAQVSQPPKPGIRSNAENKQALKS